MYFIDIWQGRVPAAPAVMAHYRALLDEQDWHKAQSFSNPDMRRRFIIIRGILRQMLANRLSMAAQSLQFRYGAHGKPEIPNRGIAFNLSHSGDNAVIAVSDLACIGVDIEHAEAGRDLERVAERCFAQAELQFWRALPEEERQAAFCRYWTRKEAFAKAVGRGLAIGLANCVIDARQDWQFCALPQEYGTVCQWRNFALTGDSEVIGAVVAPDGAFALNYLPPIQGC